MKNSLAKFSAMPSNLADVPVEFVVKGLVALLREPL